VKQYHSPFRQLANCIFDGILDLLFPPLCLVCGKSSESYLCLECIKKINFIKPPFCRTCGIPLSEAENQCNECCNREYFFEFARSVGIFDGILRDAVHAFKFDCKVMLAEPLGKLMAQHYAETHLIGTVDIVVPVPIHRFRMNERGFNQSVELSRIFCDYTSLRLEPNALVKSKKTCDQVGLPEEERFANIEGAFSVVEPDSIAGRRVLLIDDVFTTGATLNEAAKVLRGAGASAVYAYTLARRA